MVSFDKNPVAWVALVTELDDAREHLQNLVDEMVLAKSIDDQDFAVQIGHVFAHLNRSWYIRNGATLDSDKIWEEASSFHSDIETVG